MHDDILYLRRRLAEFKRHGYDIIKERNFALAKAAFEKKKRILEVGTGRGYMVLTLAQKGFRVTTIDNDRKIQKSARSILKYFHVEKQVTLKTMDARRLGFKDGSFDYVLAVNFLHHAKNPVRCLKEMIRVAREKIVIMDVNKRGAHILEKVHAKEGHRHERSKIGFSDVKEIFQRAGMEVKTYKSSCQTTIVTMKG